MSLDAALQNEIQRQLTEGIGLARAGDKRGAEVVFDRILEAWPDAEDALVWKAAVTQNSAEAVRCLRQVLQINPQNRRAQTGLEWAERRQAEQRLTHPSPTRPVIAAPPAAVVNGAAKEIPPFPTTKIDSPPPAHPKVEKVGQDQAETKAGAAPYKKSRFASQTARPFLPPEALQPVAPLKNGKSPKKNPPSFKPGKPGVAAEKRVPSGVMAAAAPRIALSVSDRVSLGSQTNRRETAPVKLLWPLVLFGLAVAVALLSFILTGLAPLLGVLAFVAALVGVVLFNQSDF